MTIKILKITAMLLMLAGIVSCQSEIENPSDMEGANFVYTEEGEKEFLKTRKDKVILKCRSADDAKALCKESVFLFAYDVGYWVVGTVDPNKTELADLRMIPGVADATYGLEYRDGTLHYPQDKIFVKFEEGKTPEEVLKTTGLSENIKAIEMYDPYYQIYFITLNVPLSDILRICQNLFESGLCYFAEPDFLLELKPY